jgi:hypothetical protein
MIKRAPHPLLAGLWRSGAAPGQALVRWQAQRELLAALTQGLRQVGIEGDDPWQALLRVPLAPGVGDTSLRSALLTLENEPLDAETPEAMAASWRFAGTDKAIAPAAAATLSRGGSLAAGRAARAAPAAAAQPTPRVAAASLLRSLSASAAAAHWQQRVHEAGLAEAFHAPLRHEAGLASTAWPDATGPALPPAAAAVTASTTSFAGPAPAEAARALQPATERIEVLLERLQPYTSMKPPAAGHPRRATAGVIPGTPAASAEQAVMHSGEPVSPQAVAANTHAAPLSVSSAALAGFGGGLRGLAARAAAAAPPNAIGAVAAMPTTTAAQPATSNARDTDWLGEAQPSPPDYEQLAERLAQLLKREALRDGIDLSEVRP